MNKLQKGALFLLMLFVGFIAIGMLITWQYGVIGTPLEHVAPPTHLYVYAGITSLFLTTTVFILIEDKLSNESEGAK